MKKRGEKRRHHVSRPFRDAAFALIGAVFVGAAHEMVSTGANGTTLLFALATLATLSLTTLVYVYTQLSDDVRHISDDLNSNTVVFEADDGGRDRLFIESTEVVKTAEKSILVLNSYAEEHEHVSDNQSLRIRKNYFDSLISKSNAGVHYQRILQYDTVKDAPTGLFERTYLDHFEEMIKTGGARELWRVTPQYPATFLIVDEKTLVLQLMEIDVDKRLEHSSNQKTPYFRMRAVVVTRDRSLVKHFKRLWKNILERHQVSPVTLGEVVHARQVLDSTRNVPKNGPLAPKKRENHGGSEDKTVKNDSVK